MNELETHAKLVREYIHIAKWETKLFSTEVFTDWPSYRVHVELVYQDPITHAFRKTVFWLSSRVFFLEASQLRASLDKTFEKHVQELISPLPPDIQKLP